MSNHSSVHHSHLKVTNSSGKSQSLVNSKDTSLSLDEPEDFFLFQEDFDFDFPDCELTRGFSQKYNSNNEIDKEALQSCIRSTGSSKIEKYQSGEFELLIPSQIRPKMMQSVFQSRIR